MLKRLKRLIIPKKKTKKFAEQKEEERIVFVEKLKTLDRSKLVYIDESGLDGNESAQRAWGLIGQRIPGVISGNRTGRISVIGGLQNNRIIAPFIFEGACNRTIFETYLEKVLLPELAEESILIMDNAAFHKGGNIDALVGRFKCEILYLPAYSPDLNPIEHFWFVLKNKVRHIISTTKKTLVKSVELAFRLFSRR